MSTADRGVAKKSNYVKILTDWRRAASEEWGGKSRAEQSEQQKEIKSTWRFVLHIKNRPRWSVTFLSLLGFFYPIKHLSSILIISMYVIQQRHSLWSEKWSKRLNSNWPCWVERRRRRRWRHNPGDFVFHLNFLHRAVALKDVCFRRKIIFCSPPSPELVHSIDAFRWLNLFSATTMTPPVKMKEGVPRISWLSLAPSLIRAADPVIAIIYRDWSVN